MSPSSTHGSNPNGLKWTVKQTARFSWQEDSEHSSSTITTLYFTSFFTDNVMIKSQLNFGNPQLTRRQYLQSYNIMPAEYGEL